MSIIAAVSGQTKFARKKKSYIIFKDVCFNSGETDHSVNTLLHANVTDTQSAKGK